MSLMLLLLATRLPAGDAAVPPAAPAEPCAPGHLAPVWTAADWRPLSPTEGRCLVTDPLPKGEGWWHLCGGVEAGGDGRVPGHCPAAPGGLALAPHPLASSSPEWDGPTHLVGLDCPGRWRAAVEGGAVTVTLEATGPGACPAPANTSWSFGSTGAAVVPPDPADLPERAVLPPGLQAAGEADRTSWTGGAHLQLVWTTGPVAGRLGGFDVRLGEAAAWNDLDVVVDDGAWRFQATPALVRLPGATTPAGGPVEVPTWVEGRFDASGGALVPVLPFRTPALRACGISVGGGIVATLAGEPEPYPYHQACRTPPDTPPDTMRFGATWTTIEWEQAPARSLPAQPAAGQEPDPGCTVVCEAR